MEVREQGRQKSIISAAARPGDRPKWNRGCSLFALVWLGGAILPAQEHGRIQGRISDREGNALGAVTVVLIDSDRPPAATDHRGRFGFDDVPTGSHTLGFSLGDLAAKVAVEVPEGITVEVDEVLDWPLSIAESLTVYSASRRQERIIDAPVAVAAVPPEQLRREAVVQLPKLFESLPGTEITQSGLFDFKLNVRGLNSTSNRRLAVLIDGRDPSMTLLDAQEWAAVAFPVDDLASAELVRGPSSALYGTNAFNGFVNLVTKSPQENLGGRAWLSIGEQRTQRLDFRYAALLPGNWYFKGIGTHFQSDEFDRSRNETLEYSRPCAGLQATDCLGLEVIPLPLDRTSISYGGLRFDREFSKGLNLVIEGGLGYGKGHTWAGPAGRVQFTHLSRPWARFDLHAPHWNLLATYDGRDSDIIGPGTGTPGYADSDRIKVELQTDWTFADLRGRIVGGVSFISEDVSSADPEGFETLISASKTTDTTAFFAQLDYSLSDRLQLVLAGRWDDHSLLDPRFSPQAALVFSVTPSQTLRVSYREAFLIPNYPQFFLRVPIAPPSDLRTFEEFCVPHGVACGFDQEVPSLFVGNPNLDPEVIEAVELGYRAAWGRSLFLNVEYYRSEAEGFVRIVDSPHSPTHAPYAPPSGLPASQASALLVALENELGSRFPFLSNPVADEPILAIFSYVNVGRIENQGVELGLDISLTRRWALSFGYSWLDFEPSEELPGFPPNSPENKFKLGLSYVAQRVSASLNYRWADDFRWVEGILNGLVPSYSVLNFALSYQLSDSWELNLNVSNLLDEEHYEFFSGDLLQRHALLSIGVSW